MTTLEAVQLDDGGLTCLARSPRLRPGAAILAMLEIHDALRHRRPDLAATGVEHGRKLLAAALEIAP